MKHLITASAAALTLFAQTGAQALTINDFDLNNFAFDITQYNAGSNAAGLGGDATASGTSGGVAWAISPTTLWTGRTTTNGSFSFAALPVLTDSLHVSGSFTITFANTIQSLLVALSNDSGNDSINFGLTPTDTRGVSLSGTQVVLNHPSGGLVLFENVQSLTINNVNNNGVADGYDLAFQAVAAVPEPSSIMMALAGLAIVTGISGRFGQRQNQKRG
jgi:PEP-CTERM motif